MDCKDNTIQRNNHHKKATADGIRQRSNLSLSINSFKKSEKTCDNE